MRFRLEEILCEASWTQRMTEELNQAMETELAKPEDQIDFDRLEDIADALLLLSHCSGEQFALTPTDVARFRRKYRVSAFMKGFSGAAAMLAVAFLYYAVLSSRTAPPTLPENSTVTAAPTTAATVTSTTQEAPVADTSELTAAEPTTEPATTKAAAPTTVTEAPATAAGTVGEAMTGMAAPDLPDDDHGVPDDDVEYYYGGAGDRDALGPYGVDDRQPVQLQLSGSYQRIYRVGETLNTDGLTMTVIYTDGSSDTLSADECTFTGFSSTSVGVKTVTAHYGRLSTSFTVEVIES